VIDSTKQLAPDLSQASRLAGFGAQAPRSMSEFAGFLDQANGGGKSEEQKLRDAAEKLVSTTMLMPMFEQLREDPLASELFHGGRSEKIFQQQLDQMFSDRIAGAARFDLVDAVYNELSARIKGGAVDTHA